MRYLCPFMKSVKDVPPDLHGTENSDNMHHRKCSISSVKYHSEWFVSCFHCPPSQLHKILWYFPNQLVSIHRQPYSFPTLSSTRRFNIPPRAFDTSSRFCCQTRKSDLKLTLFAGLELELLAGVVWEKNNVSWLVAGSWCWSGVREKHCWARGCWSCRTEWLKSHLFKLF